MSHFNKQSSSSDTGAWKTINAMLITNKCWLCEKTFLKGKQKKVFQVFHILHFFEKLSSENSISTPSADESTKIQNNISFVSANLKKCYESFISLGGTTNMDTIVSNMKRDDDVETWMSGLVCGTNEDCLREFNAMMDESRPEVATGPRAAPRFGFGSVETTGGKDCPPGCGCDNPWPFLVEEKTKGFVKLNDQNASEGSQ